MNRLVKKQERKKEQPKKIQIERPKLKQETHCCWRQPQSGRRMYEHPRLFPLSRLIDVLLKPSLQQFALMKKLTPPHSLQPNNLFLLTFLIPNPCPHFISQMEYYTIKKRGYGHNAASHASKKQLPNYVHSREQIGRDQRGTWPLRNEESRQLFCEEAATMRKEAAKRRETLARGFREDKPILSCTVCNFASIQQDP